MQAGFTRLADTKVAGKVQDLDQELIQEIFLIMGLGDGLWFTLCDLTWIKYKFKIYSNTLRNTKV